MSSINTSLRGIDKSAILLMTIGEDRAAEVFRHLTSQEVQRLSAAIINPRKISRDHLVRLLAEFEHDAEHLAVAANPGSDKYLRHTLASAFGEERADSMLEEILNAHDVTGSIKALNFMEAQMVAELIRNEHPQIIASILIYLKHGHAADILALFDETLRSDVVLRIATSGNVQPAALTELTEELKHLLDGKSLRKDKVGGVRTAAQIINMLKTRQEEAVINTIRKFDEELAQKIIDEMFLFANLIDIDDRSIQRLLQEVDSESLLIALKGCTQPLREKFLSNMSQRAANILRDDLENHAPVLLSRVEKEQKDILLIVRRLAEAGEIVIRSDRDTYV